MRGYKNVPSYQRPLLIVDGKPIKLLDVRVHQCMAGFQSLGDKFTITYTDVTGRNGGFEGSGYMILRRSGRFVFEATTPQLTP